MMFLLIRIIFLMPLLMFLLACSKPGYLIKIESEELNPAVLERLEETVKSRNFRTITKDGVTSSGRNLISEYWKDVTPERYYFIYINFFYPKFFSLNDRISLSAYIENRHKGLEPVLKTEMDELGDVIFRIISEESVDKDKVLIERKAVSPRILY